MARCGDGIATGADLVSAAEDAALDALRPLAGRRPDLAVVFVRCDDPEAATAAAERAAQLLRAGSLIGCTAAGVIGGSRGIETGNAVSVWAGLLPGVRVRAFHLEVMRSSDGAAVLGLPEPRDDDGVVIVMPDAFTFPVEGFVDRIAGVFGSLPVVGGVAVGPQGRGSTRLFLDDHVVDRGAVGVVLGGNVAARVLVSQGCRPVGPAMTVTGAQGNLVLSLAGVPASEKLAQVIADLPAQDQAFGSQGLQIGFAIDEYAEEHEHGDFLVRQVLGADRERHALVVGHNVEVGTTARFHIRDAMSASDDLRDVLAGFRASRSLDVVDGALLFSCNGRGSNLFASADHDVAAVRETLATAGVAGMFAAGEIGPVGGRTRLHGQTATMVVFGAGAPLRRDTVPGDGVPHA